MAARRQQRRDRRRRSAVCAHICVKRALRCFKRQSANAAAVSRLRASPAPTTTTMTTATCSRPISGPQTSTARNIAVAAAVAAAAAHRHRHRRCRSPARTVWVCASARSYRDECHRYDGAKSATFAVRIVHSRPPPLESAEAHAQHTVRRGARAQLQQAICVDERADNWRFSRCSRRSLNAQNKRHLHTRARKQRTTSFGVCRRRKCRFVCEERARFVRLSIACLCDKEILNKEGVNNLSIDAIFARLDNQRKTLRKSNVIGQSGASCVNARRGNSVRRAPRERAHCRRAHAHFLN